MREFCGGAAATTGATGLADTIGRGDTTGLGGVITEGAPGC